MPPIDSKELVPLAVLILGFVPILASAWRGQVVKWTTTAYTALLIGGVATVAEHLTAPTVLNYVEHGVGVGLAGVLFAVTAYINREKTRRIQQDVAEAV